MDDDLEDVALTLVADGKGILAADETVPTLTKRFAALGIHSSEMENAPFSVPGAPYRREWRDD